MRKLKNLIRNPKHLCEILSAGGRETDVIILLDLGKVGTKRVLERKFATEGGRPQASRPAKAI